MPIANDMKNIAEGIEVSYGERVEFLSDLFKGTNETLKTFHREHQKMADELRDSLSTSERERMKDFAILIGDVKAAVEAIEKDTAETRAENVRDLKEMAHKLAEFLSSSEKERLEKFATLIGDIKGAVKAIEKDTAETLADFRNSHRERIEEVSKKLSEFGREHQEMTRQLRGELSSFQKKLERIVREMRAPVINDLKEAKQNWQNLAKIMAAKRAGKVVTPARKLDEVPKQEVAEAVEAFTAGSLKEQILRLISETASGIGLVQMGRALGTPYIRLAKPASELVKEEKIRKEDSQYFKV